MIYLALLKIYLFKTHFFLVSNERFLKYILFRFLKESESVPEQINSAHISVWDSHIENCKAKGHFMQQEEEFEMKLSTFSLKYGQINGKGNDYIGDFTISGTYNSDCNTRFVKQYIGQHSVDYEGKISKTSSLDLEIRGKWKINETTDDFYLTTKID